MSSEDFDMAPMTINVKSYNEKAAEKFNQLYSLNVNDKTENKNGLTYLSWSYAWAEFKKVYPTATYNIVKNPQTGLPYFADPMVGIMVFTEVEADGLKYSMWLPVLDSSNRAMKLEPYTYQVWDKASKKYVDRKVEAATSFDLNKSIMRCLCKNLAMFGLGLYIYAGEDVPQELTTEQKQEEPTPKTKRTRKATATDRYAGIKAALNQVYDTQTLLLLYRQHEQEINGNSEIKSLFTARKQQILSNQVA